LQAVYTIAALGVQRSSYGEGGTIPDDIMEMYLEKYFIKALAQQSCQTAIEQRPFNYWRCTEMTGAGTIAENNRRQAVAEAEVEGKREAKAEAEQKKTDKAAGKTCICSSKDLFGCKARVRPDSEAAEGWVRCNTGKCKKPFCRACALELGFGGFTYLAMHRKAAHGIVSTPTLPFP
jgi:hypothetical protein